MRWWKWAAMVLLSVVIILGVAGFRRVMAPPALADSLRMVVPLSGRARINFIQAEER